MHEQWRYHRFGIIKMVSMWTISSYELNLCYINPLTSFWHGGLRMCLVFEFDVTILTEIIVMLKYQVTLYTATALTHWGCVMHICISKLTIIGSDNGLSPAGIYTKFSGRLSEEPFPWLTQKFPCILIFKTGQPGCQLNLSEGQIRLELGWIWRADDP